MPIYLRTYYLKRLQKQYNDENAAIEEARKKSQSKTPIRK
tara:strand:- start:4 stop:123 length:120 start_codon:yes stop_codon:yes gene_type:complete